MDRKNGFIKNRRTLMFFSAFLILVYHLWAVMFKGFEPETFVYRTAYIGVDIFFFLSLYSMALRKITDIKAFYVSRLKTVYFKFVVFALIAFFMQSWKLSKLLQIISGINLFKSAGGAFLWFLPAIMLVYIIYPWLQRAFGKRPIIGAAIIMVVWICGAFILSNFASKFNIMILWNRIPVMVIGSLCGACSEKLAKLFEGVKGKVVRIITGLILAFGGMWLICDYCYKVKLNVPFKEAFYVLLIPMTLAIILLVDLIPENRLIRLLGSVTLEMYAVQMVFGYKIVSYVYKQTGSAVTTNMLTTISVITISVGFHYLFLLLDYLFRKMSGKSTGQSRN